MKVIRSLYIKVFVSARTFSAFRSLLFRVKFFGNLNQRLFIGYGTKIIKHKGATINIKGSLYVDAKNDGQLGYYSNFILKENAVLNVIGNVNIYSGMLLKLFEGASLTINDGVYFSGPITIQGKKEIIIGKNCAIAWNCTIIDSNFHQIDNDRPVRTEKVSIGNNVWIGNSVIILPGTIIEDNVIVGAGSVVRGCLEKDGIYAGNPCIFIRKRR
jgi:acetyltransferase-like isoleucine patch superfamily enzyme